MIKPKAPLAGWALYDLANQFFALNIVSLYFPRWLTIEKGTPEIVYSLAFGVSMFLVAVCAPFLGALSDSRGNHKPFLIVLTLISVAFTMSLGLTSNVFWALVFFAVANFGCQEAIIFYNALMVKVAPPGRIGLVSGLGRMFGYSGAILALFLTKPIILNRGYHATFLFTGILFLVFALPCMILVKEKPFKDKISLFEKERLLSIFTRLRTTISESYKFADLRNLLKASFFGLCAINTTILFMSIYAGKAFGLAEEQIIDLVAFSTVFAIIGSFLSGLVSDLIGCRRSLLGVFILWGISIFAGALLHPPFHWLVGALVGISLGSTWVILRAFVIKLVPEEKIGEAFGLFNMVSYFAGMVGPIFWGVLLLYFSRFGGDGYRVAFLGLIVFIATGAVFVLRISDNPTIAGETQDQEAAR